MRKKILFTFVLIFTVTACATKNPQQFFPAPDETNQILRLVLTRDYDDGKYNVIQPQTNTIVEHFFKNREKRTVKFINRWLKRYGVNEPALVDALLAQNAEPTTLTLTSNPQKGYLIDYDGEFAHYFKQHGVMGWKEWREEKPDALSYVSISLPVYNKESNIILIYRDFVTGGKAGAGIIIAYTYENGKLELITRVRLWIS